MSKFSSIAEFGATLAIVPKSDRLNVKRGLPIVSIASIFLGVFKFALRPNGGWRREFEGLPEIEGLIEGPLSVFV